jgi:NADPH:quinone reductase
MKAILVSSFGAPEVLRVTELPDPAPGPGEVAVDVTCAAVGLIDVFIRQGLYRDRPGLLQPPYVPGLEVAGQVGRQLDAALAPGVATVVADMTATRFCDTSGIHMLVLAHRRAAANTGHAIYRAPAPPAAQNRPEPAPLNMFRKLSERHRRQRTPVSRRKLQR